MFIKYVFNKFKDISLNAVVFFVLESIWLLLGLACGLFGFMKYFFPSLIPSNVDAEPIQLFIALLGVTAAGLWKAHNKLGKQTEEQISIIKTLNSNILVLQSEMTQIKISLPLIESLTHLTESGRECIENLIKSRSDLDRILSSIDDKTLSMINKTIHEGKKRIKAGSMARITTTLDEAPTENLEIMKIFCKRMDAVSENDLDFWISSTGKEYFEKSTKFAGRSGRFESANISRIFILNNDNLCRENELAKILEEHFKKKIGFAICSEHHVESLITRYKINDNEEDSPRLDFALFDEDSVVTFFRSEKGNGDRKRFKAIFKVNQTDSEFNKNNNLVKTQRKIWVDIIYNCTLVSSHFVDGLTSAATWTELEYIKKHAGSDLQTLKNKQYTPDNEMFLFEIKNFDEIKTKLELTKKFLLDQL